jgi:hypothetical protein
MIVVGLSASAIEITRKHVFWVGLRIALECQKARYARLSQWRSGGKGGMRKGEEESWCSRQSPKACLASIGV